MITLKVLEMAGIMIGLIGFLMVILPPFNCWADNFFKASQEPLLRTNGFGQVEAVDLDEQTELRMKLAWSANPSYTYWVLAGIVLLLLDGTGFIAFKFGLVTIDQINTALARHDSISWVLIAVGGIIVNIGINRGKLLWTNLGYILLGTSLGLAIAGIYPIFCGQ